MFIPDPPLPLKVPQIIPKTLFPVRRSSPLPTVLFALNQVPPHLRMIITTIPILHGSTDLTAAIQPKAILTNLTPVITVLPVQGIQIPTLMFTWVLAQGMEIIGGPLIPLEWDGDILIPAGVMIGDGDMGILPMGGITRGIILLTILILMDAVIVIIPGIMKVTHPTIKQIPIMGQGETLQPVTEVPVYGMTGILYRTLPGMLILMKELPEYPQIRELLNLHPIQGRPDKP